MRKKYIIILTSLVFSIMTYSSKWTYDGISNGGLMILYKSLPPTSIMIETPEVMTVSKNQGTFWYSEVSPTRAPIKVDIKIKFNDGIVNNADNGLNKEIIYQIYDQVELTFLDNGVFSLTPTDSNVVNEQTTIDAEAYFVKSGGVILDGENGKKVQRKFINTIQNGLLTIDNSPIYIDAQFNKKNKELMSGSYSGTVKLEIEFKGKGGI